MKRIELTDEQLADLKNILASWRDRCETKRLYRLECFDSKPTSSINRFLQHEAAKAERLLRVLEEQ